MVLRLYRDDSFLTDFTARVIGAGPAGAGLIAVELDRTAFYPTGGGQPHDTGTLGGCAVIDVKEAGGGRVLHIVRADLAPAGRIEGRIDWPRRFDHMQQHTGQHILSAAFVELEGAVTRSFHLGVSACTIDVDLRDPTGEKIRAVEALANKVIFSDAPVGVSQVPADRAPSPAAAKELARELALKPGDPIRIIRVGEFDETPCGGTHVAGAAAVGCVAIRSWGRFKGGTRVTFLCGGRVVTALHALGRVVDDCVAHLSAQPEDVPAALARLKEQVAESRRKAKTLADALMGAEAVALDATARVVGPFRILVEVFTGRPADEMAMLARKYTASPSRLALIGSIDPASGKAGVVFARSEEKGLATVAMGEILAQICRTHGGRGGGQPALARGGGIPAGNVPEALEEAFRLVGDRIGS